MGVPMRFRPKNKIRRMVKSRELVVFYPGAEYHGEILNNGTIVSNSGKYEDIFTLRKSEVKILEYL